MIEQEVTIQLSDDPFDTKTIKVKVPKGTKLMCNEAYVAEALEKYESVTFEEDGVYNCENKTDYITQGNVLSVNGDTALIDIGTKFTATCSLAKEPEFVRNQLEPGIKVDVKVRPGFGGSIIASISDAMDEVKRKEILDSIGDKTIGFTAKVKELIHGGYWLELGGITCFMPGSLAGLNKLHDFESLVGKELVVMPITYSREKDTIVVSHREYLRTLIPSALETLNENIKEKITGFVTGTTKFGVFAEFNQCLTGLIIKDDLDDETLAKFENREIKPGDQIDFWVKEIISEKKIILNQKGPRINIWDDASEKYKPMMVTKGKVTKIAKYGAFVELEKGISGLIHKSKLKDVELSKGDVIDVKIQSVNTNDRKITMTTA